MEQYIYHNSITDKWITKSHFPHRIAIIVSKYSHYCFVTNKQAAFIIF